MQTICTSIQTDDHTNTSSLNFYRPDALPDALLTVSKRCRTKNRKKRWVLGCSGISWTICKQSAPHSRQTTTPTPHHSIFSGRMLLLVAKPLPTL